MLGNGQPTESYAEAIDSSHAIRLLLIFILRSEKRMGSPILQNPTGYRYEYNNLI